MELSANAARFSGFADLYDRARPSPPMALARVLCAYAREPRPALVVDLGSGTGLSSRWCGAWAAHVIGVEPSADMRTQAAASTATPPNGARIRYVDGWGHQTGLPDGCASVVVAVQSLHWMEPKATFAEIDRLLRPGGVFAAIDCDWPPSVGNADAEEAWTQFTARAEGGGPPLTVNSAALRPAQPDGPPVESDARALSGGARGWPKEGHLQRMRSSGHFRWCRELIMHNEETGDAERLVDLLGSHGGVQELLKAGRTPDELGFDAFRQRVHGALGEGERPFWFTYRARIGLVRD